MKVCPSCQSENEDSAKLCLGCGALLLNNAPASEPETSVAKPEEPASEPGADPETVIPNPEAPASAPEAPSAEPEAPAAEPEAPAAAPENKANTLTTGQYFWLEALFSLPVVGIVCLFIWSLGHPKNESLKRFSSSVLIWRLIGYILFIVALGCFLINFKDWAPEIARFLNTAAGR